MAGRVDVLTNLKTILEAECPSLVKAYAGKQTDWETESEYPVAWIFYPNQMFNQMNIATETLSVLKGTGLLVVRVAVENNDQTPELQLEVTIDEILLALIKNSTLKVGSVQAAKTTDILAVETDGGVIIDYSIANISIEVQI